MAHTKTSKKKKEYRPENDFYPTPKCLVRKLVETGELHGLTSILEPACGNNAIVDILHKQSKKDSIPLGWNMNCFQFLLKQLII